MKTKRLNDSVKPWFVSIIILLLVIIALFLHFFVTSRQKEQTEVQDKIITVVQGYAADVAQRLNGIQKSVEAISSYMEKVPEGQVDNSAVIASICENLGVYDAVICDVDGKGINGSGMSVDLSGMDYFGKAFTEENKVFFVENDGINGKSAIVIVSPVMVANNVEKYIICFYDTANFETLVKRVDFSSMTFYMLVDTSGQVVAAAGNTDSILCQDSSDYFTFLKQAGDNKRDAERMYTRMQNGNSDIGYFAGRMEQKCIVYVPVGIGRFYLLAGIPQNYVEKEVKREWSASGSMMWRCGIAFMIFVAVLIIMNVIDKKKEKEKSRQLANKADTDLLTDLYNKVATERKIKEYIAEHPDELGLMFVLDIDNFKKINDTMGHAFGDEVLRTLGVRIKAEFRSSDIVGRTGGDEFTIFLRNMKGDAVIKSEAQRVERFFKNFQAGEYVKYSATASIGAAVYPTDAKNFEALYKAADQALYVAKKRGKNQLAFYGDEA